MFRNWRIKYLTKLIESLWWGVLGVTEILGKANIHFNPTQTGSGIAPPRWGGCWLVQKSAGIWNLPFFAGESTLSSLCSRFDLPLSRQGAALALLDSLSHDLVLWTNGSVPFPFGEGCSGVLAKCYLCGIEATLSFSAGPVCSSFSAEACAILHTLCWSWKHHKVCHFSSLLLLSDSRSVLATLSSLPSFLLP